MKKTEPPIRIQMPAFNKQMQRLKSIYTNTWFMPDMDAVETWYDALGAYSEKQIKHAVDTWIKTSQVEPKPIDLINVIEASGMDNYGGTKGDPTQWPAIVVVRRKDRKILYECFVSPTAEVVAAKKHATEYVLTNQRKCCIDKDKNVTIEPYAEAEIETRYMSNEQYRKEILKK